MSAFTALNGSSPKTDSQQSQQPQQQSSQQSQQEQGAEKASPSQSHHIVPSTSPRRSLPTEAPASHRESWPTQVPRQSDPQTPTSPELDLTKKRKRSVSPETHRDIGGTNQTTPEAGTATTNGDTLPSNGTPQQEQSRFASDHHEREPWYNRESRDERSQHERHPSSGSHADDQASDSNRRGQGDQHSDYGNNSPEAEDHAGLNGSAETRGDGMVQHDPKKRKRNFSNRTKTGCLTCRRRKKKCDEQKPECINCIRGGFVCAGYPPQRGTHWPKIDNKAGAVPLESKDPSYVPPGAYGMPQPGHYVPPQPVKREPLPLYRGQTLRIDPPQGRPLLGEEDRPLTSALPSASVASPPDNKLSSISYTPATAFPTPVSANTQPTPFGERMGKDYQRVPPLHDLTRPEHDTHHSNQLPQISLLHHGRMNSPPNHNTPSHPPSHPSSHQSSHQSSHSSHPTSHPPSHSHGPTANPQVAAQLALSHTQFPPRRTQKEEMLTGRHFYPFDKELCLERERCATACWKFNTLTAPPTNGVSSEERARLFLEILQPRDAIRISPTEASPITNVGRVGRHVAVETPFNCDYGYNISIGHHVVVGRNCTINDICEVKIGDNCVLGPNVSIYTTNLPIDPKKRQGGQGPQFGRPVVIEQDCWIGGGATILPGRTIGKGSTVGAGSIVTKDVPPFTVVAGNPARVLRGIAS